MTLNAQFNDYIRDMIRKEHDQRQMMFVPMVITSHRELAIQNPERYKRRVIETFYYLLVDDWLYNSRVFVGLLPYFTVTEQNGKIYISPIVSITHLNHHHRSDEEKSLIDYYIEQHYINQHIVAQLLQMFINYYNMTWYDLYTNKKIVQQFLFNGIKQMIIQTIQLGYVQ